jgi:hypothetical protein
MATKKQRKQNYVGAPRGNDNAKGGGTAGAMMPIVGGAIGAAGAGGVKARQVVMKGRQIGAKTTKYATKGIRVGVGVGGTAAAIATGGEINMALRGITGFMGLWGTAAYGSHKARQVASSAMPARAGAAIGKKAEKAYIKHGLRSKSMMKTAGIGGIAGTVAGTVAGAAYISKRKKRNGG